MDKKKSINIQLSEQLWRRAKSVAALDGKPVNQWLEEAIEKKLVENRGK